MPGSPKIPNSAPYSKTQDGEFSADGALRAIVKIGSVSAGVEFDANLVGTPEVTISGVANVNIGDNVLLTPMVTTVSTTGASATELIAAQGASDAIRVHGFSVFNETESMLRVELRYGNTPFWRGSLAAEGGGMNWNVVGRALQGSDNTAVNVYHAAAGTTTISVFWEKV